MTFYKITVLAGVSLAMLGLGSLGNQAQASFAVGPLTVDPNLTALPPIAGTLFSLDLSGFSSVVSSGTYTLPGGAILSLNGIAAGDAGYAGVVQGSAGGKYAAPVTDSAGAKYAGNYLSTGIGSITITFPALEDAFALLWGSVDSYNTISFDTLGGPVSFTGALMPVSGGSQGFGGSFYTAITSLVPFSSVTLSSSQYAFEAATFVYGTGLHVAGTAVPEPASLALLGVGLLGLVAINRQRKAA